MKHNIDEWRYNILRSNSRVAMPIMTHPGIELINSTVQEAVTCGETHFKALEVLYQKYPTAAVTMIMDLTVEAEAFGCKINFEEDDIPNVADRLISEVGEIDNLTVPNISESARLSEYLKASKLAVQNIKDVPVFPGCIGPFSLAGRLIDMSEIMVDIYLYPDSIHNLLQKCTVFIKEYISAYKALGTNGIVIAEPAAGLLGNDECSQFSSDYIKDIVDEFQDDDFLIILHNCGHEGGLTQTMVETGVKALHLGNIADMKMVLENAPEDILVMGNLDPVSVFQSGTEEYIKEETRNLLDLTASYSNFVISSGCDMPPKVPFQNIDAFFHALEEYNTCKVI